MALNLRPKRPKFWFWSYHQQSQSVAGLVDALDGRIIRRERSRYQQQPEDIVINWGVRLCPFPGALNNAEAVDVATSKLRTYAVLTQAGIRTPTFTTDQSVAATWLQRGMVLGRDQDRGSQGRGISVYVRHTSLEGHPEFATHRFFTRYLRRDREIRVHIFRGQVIFQQEKLRGRDREVDPYIASHNRGWVFGFNHLHDHPVPESLTDVARRAVSVLGLDFGAVDCVWNNRTSTASVLEVNTAPGLENTSLAAYVSAFRSLV